MGSRITATCEGGRLWLDAPGLRLAFSLVTGQWLEWHDLETGLIITLSRDGESTLALILGGEEHRPPPRREPYYTQAEVLSAGDCYQSHRLIDDGLSHTLEIQVRRGDWLTADHYQLSPHGRQVRHRLELTYLGPGDATIRYAELTYQVGLPDGDGWVVKLPGWDGQPSTRLLAQMPQVPLLSLDAPFINVGLTGFHHPGLKQNLLVWPFSWTDSTDVRIQAAAGGATLHYQVKAAKVLASGNSLRLADRYVAIRPGPWQAALAAYQDGYRAMGLDTPADRPGWTRQAAIYEVHIGTAVFRDDFTYTPYPSLRALLADLPRIQELGFEVVQIMPRQPYPCYAVHDYYDITTSYGDEEDLREVIRVAHDMGLRVILDVLMHGVIDGEIIDEVEASVRNVPDDYWPELRQTVIDFAPYWRAGSSHRHPLADAHPEWFMRTAEGRVASIYTRAFDVANAEWQAYFIEAMTHLVRELDIDGFRFDAPNWNSFPDWNPNRPYRASFSTFASVQLFEKARRALRALKPDLLFYTESSGPLFRLSLDLNYNYDEQWLIPAVMEGRLSARQMAEWFDQRRLALPAGSLTAHHVDSHDTFWWAPPGKKWRREQYGLAATQALVSVLALIDGAFMNYVGGEAGQEAHVEKLLRLRRTLPELGSLCDYRSARSSDERVFTAWRSNGQCHSLVVVNLSDKPLATSVSVPGELLGSRAQRWMMADALATPTAHETLVASSPGEPVTFFLQLEPYQSSVLALRAAQA